MYRSDCIEIHSNLGKTLVLCVVRISVLLGDERFVHQGCLKLLSSLVEGKLLEATFVYTPPSTLSIIHRVEQLNNSDMSADQKHAVGGCVHWLLTPELLFRSTKHSSFAANMNVGGMLSCVEKVWVMWVRARVLRWCPSQ